MKYRKLDNNSDMIFGGGANDYFTDLDAVKQACKTRMLLFQNEWWENIEDGLPFVQQIAGYQDKDLAASLIRKRLQGTPEVFSVTNVQISFEPSSRAFTFSADVVSTYGSFTIGMDI